MLIIKYRKVFFALTGILLLLSLASVAFFGLTLGTDFTGGVLAEVRYGADRPGVEELSQSLENAGFTGHIVRESENNAYIIRAGNVSSEVRSKLQDTTSLGNRFPATIERFTEIGPTVGIELRNKSLIALSLVLVCILLYIAFAFRKVSQPVSSWIYGMIALVTLLHDVIVPSG